METQTQVYNGQKIQIKSAWNQSDEAIIQVPCSYDSFCSDYKFSVPKFYALAYSSILVTRITTDCVYVIK